MLETKRVKGDPRSLIVVTSAVVKKDERFKPFFQPRHDAKPDADFVASIKREGVLQKPLVAVFGKQRVVLAGNKRVMGAVAAGLAEIEYDLMQLDWKDPKAYAYVRDIQVAENEQRFGNTIFDRLHNITAYLQLDPKTGKPKGLSFEETGKRFRMSHQQVRNLALLAVKAPKWLLEMIENAEINVTEATNLVKANLKGEGDEASLKAMVDEWRSKAVVSGTGKARSGKSGGDRRSDKARSAKPTSKLINAWIKSAKTPPNYRILFQVVTGAITIEEAWKLLKGSEEWLFLEVPKKAKKEKKSKDDEVTEEDVAEVEDELFEDEEDTEDEDEDEFDEDDEEEYDEDEDEE